MTSWAERSNEERALLNPAFCTNLLWHAARGYASASDGALSFEESFLVLPFVLHRDTREALPRASRTSLPVWLNDNPLVRGRVISRARLLISFTREALTFGGVHGLILLVAGGVRAEPSWQKAVNRTIKASSGEVRSCAKRAAFIGKWFAQTGNASTVLALIGARP